MLLSPNACFYSTTNLCDIIVDLAAGNIRFYQQLAVLASLISSAHRWEIGSRHCSMSLSPSSYRPRQRYIVPTRSRKFLSSLMIPM
ncbi:Os04g0259150 [Oryza sativa Japonica Group]|uniref:Os04g0259150 protein n=2 Tax=Oryza TaxID=4527 RepID=C7J1H2_ORYSJ|nr:Os04g0259150 [Oryza sativa Japonica Group]|eukprot:NP_001173816.1 Os04g0259150 [Oryza sativa Japonica Group]